MLSIVILRVYSKRRIRIHIFSFFFFFWNVLRGAPRLLSCPLRDVRSSFPLLPSAQNCRVISGFAVCLSAETIKERRDLRAENDSSTALRANMSDQTQRNNLLRHHSLNYVELEPIKYFLYPFSVSTLVVKKLLYLFQAARASFLLVTED